MKLRWLLIIALLLLVTSATVALVVLGRKAMEHQKVVLSDGTILEFVYTSYGTNHVVGSPVALACARLPKSFQAIVAPIATKFGPVQRRNTTKPVFAMWYQVSGSSNVFRSNYDSAGLADETGFTSGKKATLFGSSGTVAGTYMLEFEVQPRRSKTFQLHIHDGGTQSHLVLTNFPNPLFDSYPQWTPEALPSTKSVGDLEVTLLQFGTGFSDRRHSERKNGTLTTVFERKKPHGENRSVMRIAYKQAGKTNAPWTVTKAILTDATGNSIAQQSMTTSANWCSFSPSLWPDEACWKLELIVKRTGDFAANELVTFKDVPLGSLNQTNTLGLTTNFNGVTFTLERFVLRSGPPTNSSSWTGEVYSELNTVQTNVPAGYYLDLYEVRSGTNKWDNRGWGESGERKDYTFEHPPEVTTADFTFVLHRSRSVEFLVKPTVADPTLTRSEKND